VLELHFNMQQQVNNMSNNNQTKSGNEKLKKSVDGNNYVKWLERLREDFASNSASCVKQYGPDLLRDQRGWLERYRAEYAESDDIEKSALSRKKGERQNAIEIIYNLILSRLSEEVKQLVEADSEYVAMRDDMQLRGPYELLGVVRRVVSTGITSDHVYQTMIGVKTLHEVLGTDKPSAPWFKTGLNH
jgi:hypothetical protein